MTQFKNLLLNNDTVAVFDHVDFWSRPNYYVTHNDKKHLVCCTELDGSHLHTLTSGEFADPEPCSPLAQAYQPKAEQPETEPQPATDTE